MSLVPRLAEALDVLARRRETVTYGALARQLAIPAPGSIAKLTGALEDLMAQDAKQRRPFRAALCTGRLLGDLPAPGFFAAATRLGRYAGPVEGAEAEAFVQTERAALFNLAAKG